MIGYSEKMFLLDSPVFFFRIGGKDFDFLRFADRIIPYFDRLPFDYYDVRLAHLNYFLKKLPEKKEEIEKIKLDYYAGRLGLDSLKELIELVPGAEEDISGIKPWRRRALSIVNFVRDGRLWNAELKDNNEFSQNTNDIRSVKRKFSSIDKSLLEFLMTQRSVNRIPRLVSMFNKNVKRIEVTIHMMGLIASDSYEVYNAPEGVHQDGVDYIVSALVIDRKNVEGGESIIYGPDKKTILYSHELKQGEGIFQADANTDLWHDVTPIKKIDKNFPGHRYVLGLDLRVLS